MLKIVRNFHFFHLRAMYFFFLRFKFDQIWNEGAKYIQKYNYKL